MIKIYNPSFLFLFIALHGVLNAGDTPKTLVWKNGDCVLIDLLKRSSFNGLKILDYDGDITVAEQLAKTAKIVHSRITDEEPQERPIIENLFFIDKKDFSDDYDWIIISDIAKLSKDNVLHHFRKCYKLLNTKGRLLTFFETQKDINIFQLMMDKIYPQIHQAIPEKQRKDFPTKQDSRKDLFSYKDLSGDKIHWGCFTCVSYQPKKYNLIIEDKKEYKTEMKTMFSNALASYEIADDIFKGLQKQFINLVLSQLQSNENGHLIHPFNITEVLWKKLVITININRFLSPNYGNSCGTDTSESHSESHHD